LPTYDYKCLKCNKSFEFFQYMKDEPLKNCPDCNGEVKRLIGAGAGTIFKGTGFYQTDYKNLSKPSDTKTSAKANISKNPSNESKTEKKSTTDK